ncbi:MAG: glycosyltransferase family 2 protein [Leptospiraceae bacterium]|nr:glycosyltransferase family 2 protein [Leptospiraceae bacterium]MDW7976976.1 glycosyltransferase family 2 protein [Leptospiraceae bacterium]
MVSISAAIITYNEEQNIRECIQSLLEICDEIVVLDSYSTDRTKEICLSFDKVKFYEHPFDGHVEQKNRAIELCSHEWILSLDADERVSETLKKEILFLKNHPEIMNQYTGFQIPRLTYHLGKFIYHSGWYPQRKYRLFRKGFAKWEGENPHDYIVIQGKGKKLKGDILHYSFKDLSHQIDTINKFSSIVAFNRYHRKKKFSVFRSIYKPISKFIEIYFVKRGFLDGYPGFIISVASAFSSFLKEAKIYELKHQFIERPSNLRKDYQYQKKS